MVVIYKLEMILNVLEVLRSVLERLNLACGGQFQSVIFNVVSAPFDLKYLYSLSFSRYEKSVIIKNRRIKIKENFLFLLMDAASLMTELGFKPT